MKQLPLILFAVGLNTIAQLGLKAGMRVVGYFEFSQENLWPVMLQLMRNPYIVGSCFIYVVSVFAWMAVLSRAEVSFAYPMTSIGYILTAVLGYLFLQEHVSLIRLIGIGIIILGVYLVARS